MSDKYEVIVGNIGTMEFDNQPEAESTYAEYVEQSKQNYGRAAGESVTLLKNNEIVQEHFGSLDDDLNDDLGDSKEELEEPKVVLPRM